MMIDKLHIVRSFWICNRSRAFFKTQSMWYFVALKLESAHILSVNNAYSES